MLLKVIAWLWIISGIIFLLKPSLLQKGLQKKGNKKLKGILFFILIGILSTLLAVAFKTRGPLPKVLALIGIIAAFKLFVFLRKKAASKIAEWLYSKPVVMFRGAAVVYILIGLSLLLFFK
ncbi:MAG: hypothetical protein PHU64_03075 [Candidatus Omnitrophica bacterium]|nr:hypothetical protein [Candidatus Omnitrophota bacterium]